jgi:hypothetical protein
VVATASSKKEGRDGGLRGEAIMAARVVYDSGMEDRMRWVAMDDMLADRTAATRHDDEWIFE